MYSDPVAAQKHFGELLVHLEHDVGTRDTCVIFLQCLREALTLTSFATARDVQSQVAGFYQLFLGVRPRMAIVQHYLDRAMDVVVDHPEASKEELIRLVLEEIDRAESDGKACSAQLMQRALSVIEEGSRILIHSHSHTVLDALRSARKAGRTFDVVVAEQEIDRTLDMVRFLRDADIPFRVVPEYMLSHIEDDISMMLIGAVTLKEDMNFAVDAGTRAVVSEMRSAGVPVVLLMSSNKFSYWKTHKSHQVVHTVKTLFHKQGKFEYERVKFSHDRLPLDQLDRVVTEEGVFSV